MIALRTIGRSWVLRAIVPTLFVALGVSALAHRFSIGIDPQQIQCLPGSRLVILDRGAGLPERGEVWAFQARGLAPFFADGTLIFKVVDGVPGDAVEVSDEGVRVNGRLVSQGLPLAERLQTAPERFTRSFKLHPGEYLLLGRTAESYDGRYWGVVKEQALIGHVYQLMREWS